MHGAGGCAPSSPRTRRSPQTTPPRACWLTCTSTGNHGACFTTSKTLSSRWDHDLVTCGACLCKGQWLACTTSHICSHVSAAASCSTYSIIMIPHRAALAPFIANMTVGMHQYKWILYGDDDTVFNIDNVLRLVNGLNASNPYLLTDCLWFPQGITGGYCVGGCT